MKKIINKINLTWFLGINCAVLLSLCVAFYMESRYYLKSFMDEKNYLDNKRISYSILTEREQYLKVTSFYSQIAATYWYKWSPSKKNKPNEQGLNKHQKAKLFDEIYNLSKLLSLHPMELITFITVESEGLPYVDKTIVETGLYQQRHEAVGQAFIYYNQMPEYLKKECSFYYNSSEDLKDFINATRIHAVLIWGSKNVYKRDMAWWVTGIHWGTSRIWTSYKNGILPPSEFKFNVGTVREDIRKPFTYYFFYNEFFYRFSRFEIDVNISKSWIDSYKKSVSKMEWEYIETQRDFMRVRSMIEELNEEKEEFNKSQEEKKKRLNDLSLKLENKYREMNGLIKKGKFTNIKEIYLFMRSEFKSGMKEIVDPQVEKNRKIALFILVCVLSILSLFSLIGFGFVMNKGVYYVRKKVSKLG